MSSQKNFYQTETVSVKYPFSIAKIFPKEIKNHGPFNNKPKTVYNVEAFGAVKFLCTQFSQKLTKDYPGYEYNIYAWRSTAPTIKEDRMVHNIKFSSCVNHAKSTVYVDIELLPASQAPEPTVEDHEDDAFDVSHLDLNERRVLASLFQSLIAQEQEQEQDVVELEETLTSPLELEEDLLEEAVVSKAEDVPATPLLRPRRPQLASVGDDAGKL